MLLLYMAAGFVVRVLFSCAADVDPSVPAVVLVFHVVVAITNVVFVVLILVVVVVLIVVLGVKGK